MESVTVTNSDIATDERLHKFLYDAYIDHQDVIIPNELLKDFVEIACRRSIASVSPFVK